MAQIFANGLVTSAVYTILALGFGLIYFTTKNFHLAHGAVFASGAYLGWWLVVRAGLSLPIALVVAPLGAALVGLAIEWSIYRPLVNRRASPEVILIASLAAYIVVVNVIAMFAGNEVQLLRAGASTTWEVAGARITTIQVLQLASALSVSLGLAAVLKWTRVGHLWRAIGDSPELVSLTGWNVGLHRFGVFASGSALAGFAGVLVALDVGAEPHMGFAAVLAAVTACIVGGLGRYMAPILGAVLLGIAESVVVAVLASRWRSAVTLSLLILFLVVRPLGLLGRPLRGEER